MHPNTVDALTETIRTCRYLTEAQGLAPALLQLHETRKLGQLTPLARQMDEYTELLRALLEADEPAPATFADTEKTYHMLKSRMLGMIVRGEFSAIAGERTLDTLSSVRRLTDQWQKSLAWQPATELLNGDVHAEGSTNRT